MDVPRMESALALLRDELRCSLCQEQYNEPVSLPCCCVFCRTCVMATLEGPGVYKTQCPTCALPCRARDLQPHTKVASFAQLYQALLAELAKDGAGGLPGEAVLQGAADAADGPLAAFPELQQWVAIQQGPNPTGTAAELHADVLALEEGLRIVAMQLRELQYPTRSEEEEEEEEEEGEAEGGESRGGRGSAGDVHGVEDDEAERHPAAPQPMPSSAAPDNAEAVALLAACNTSQLRKLCRHSCANAGAGSGWTTWSSERMRKHLKGFDAGSIGAVLALSD